MGNKKDSTVFNILVFAVILNVSIFLFALFPPFRSGHFFQCIPFDKDLLAI